MARVEVIKLGEPSGNELLSKGEKLMFTILWPDDPEKIKDFQPGNYVVRNTKTRRDKTYYALSKFRALALAYLDQGEQHRLELVE